MWCNEFQHPNLSSPERKESKQEAKGENYITENRKVSMCQCYHAASDVLSFYLLQTSSMERKVLNATETIPFLPFSMFLLFLLAALIRCHAFYSFFFSLSLSLSLRTLSSSPLSQGECVSDICRSLTHSYLSFLLPCIVFSLSFCLSRYHFGSIPLPFPSISSNYFGFNQLVPIHFGSLLSCALSFARLISGPFPLSATLFLSFGQLLHHRQARLWKEEKRQSTKMENVLHEGR